MGCLLAGDAEHLGFAAVDHVGGLEEGGGGLAGLSGGHRLGVDVRDDVAFVVVAVVHGPDAEHGVVGADLVGVGDDGAAVGAGLGGHGRSLPTWPVRDMCFACWSRPTCVNNTTVGV